MKFNKSCIVILAFVVLAIPVMAQTSAVNNSMSCSLATLNGMYGDFEQGTILAPFPGFPAPPFPVVLVGIVTYDGAGHVSATYTSSMGGVILPGTAAGTYVVNPDCSYSDVLTEANGPGGHHVGTIIGHGIRQEVQLMYTDPWLVASATLRKIPPEGCSQKAFNGTYAVFGQGTDVNVPFPGFPPPPFPMSHVAKLTADGAGNFSGGGTEDMDGVAFPATFTATYTVTSDCSVSATIADTALGITISIPWQGTITGEGRFQEVHGITTSPGSVFADTWRK